MQTTAKELAAHIGANLKGDGKAFISGIAAPEDAGLEDLIYVAAEKHADRAQESRAKCAIVAEGIALIDKTLLVCKDPKFAFAKAAAWLLAPPEISFGIHSTAIVHPRSKLAPRVSIGPYCVIESGARIGEGTQIGPFCFVGKDAVIGEECHLHPRVTLYSGAKLGKRVVVHSGAVVGGDGFGYVYSEGRYWKFPQIGSVEVGDDVEIGDNATVAKGSLGRTQVCDGVKLDNLVHIAHNVRIGEHTVIAAQTGISGSSEVGAHVVMGGQVGIGDHCRIEEGAILGGQAGILTGKTIYAHETVWGTPARPLERFKRQYAWFVRLPELAERIHRLEAKKTK